MDVTRHLTDQSWLRTVPFEDRALLEQCVKEVRPLLQHRPQIVVYNKPAHQRRNVGFFSNESSGYLLFAHINTSSVVSLAISIWRWHW